MVMVGVEDKKAKSKCNENLILQWQTKKMAKFYKMAKYGFSWPAQLKNDQIFRNRPWNGQSGNTGTDPVIGNFEFTHIYNVGNEPWRVFKD